MTESDGPIAAASPPRAAANPWTRRLSALLRLGAVIEMLAFPWSLIPRAWMERSHEWLGMGTMPTGAVVDFTIRQSAFFYGMHGVLMWVLARDVARFQPVVRLIGWTYVVFGPAFFLIDWTSGTPAWWTACDPVVTCAFGVLLLWCERNRSRQPAQTAGPEQSVRQAQDRGSNLQNVARA